MSAIQNIFQQSLSIFPVTIKPENYFQNNTEPATMRTRVLYGTGLLLILTTLCVFLSALLNAEELHQIQINFLQRMGVELKYLPEPGIPFSSLIFGLYWLILVIILGTFRYGMIKLLGEPMKPVALPFLITLHSVIPLIIAGASITIFNNLFPPEVPGETTDASFRLIVTTAVSLIGFCWEGIIATKGFRFHYQQYTGRAILTTLAPWLMIGITLLVIAR